jgi:hypothetical protein
VAQGVAFVCCAARVCIYTDDSRQLGLEQRINGDVRVQATDGRVMGGHVGSRAPRRRATQRRRRDTNKMQLPSMILSSRMSVLVPTPAHSTPHFPSPPLAPYPKRVRLPLHMDDIG